MAVTTSQIRDLLNRPTGLVEGTITEYINMRDREATKIARTSSYNIGTDHQVTTDLKEDFIKAAVCVDCLIVLIDTLPSDLEPNQRTVSDTRFREQLNAFKERMATARQNIAEPNAAAFATDSTATRQE